MRDYLHVSPVFILSDKIILFLSRFILRTPDDFHLAENLISHDWDVHKVLCSLGGSYSALIDAVHSELEMIGRNVRTLDDQLRGQDPGKLWPEMIVVLACWLLRLPLLGCFPVSKFHLPFLKIICLQEEVCRFQIKLSDLDLQAVRARVDELAGRLYSGARFGLRILCAPARYSDINAYHDNPSFAEDVDAMEGFFSVRTIFLSSL